MNRGLAIFSTLLLAAAAAIGGELRAAAEPAKPAARVAKASGISGIRKYAPETWGIVSAEVVNPSDRDAEMLVSSYFGVDPGLQFGRRIWVPAGARRMTWYPIFPPAALSPGKSPIEIRSLVLEQTGSREVLVNERTGEKVWRSLLPLMRQGPVTGVLVDRSKTADQEVSDVEEEAAVDGITVSRQYRRLSRVVVPISDAFFPPTAAALDGLDQLVLINDRVASDTAALAAIRRWLQNGGRLWIMLDRVRLETVELLLGDAAPYQVVDRVGLTQVRLDAVDRSLWGVDDTAREYETPVPHVRVIASDVDIAHTVGGWPASFWQRFGRGQVLYTTVGMRAWTRRAVRGGTNSPLANLALEFYSPKAPPPLRPELFREYLSQQIGYEIVSRRVVLLVLGGFCLCLLATGIWLARRERLEMLRWLATAASMAAAGVLLLLGAKTRHAVPDTVAVMQLVHVEPDSEDVTVNGVLAMYHQVSTDETIGVRQGGLLRPGFAGRRGTTRRMIWTDIDRWHWENLSVPAGVHVAPFCYSRSLARPVRASGRFGPEGLMGRLQAGPFENAADAVLATPSRLNMAVRWRADGSFVAGPFDLLASEEFITGTLLSDEQRRRQAVYRQLLPGVSHSKFADRTTMLVWTRPLDMRFEISRQAKQVGSALLAVPLRLERTPPATRVVFPSPFLPFRVVNGPDGRVSSSTYNNEKGEWIERTGATQTWLRFQLPREATPIRLDRATVTVHITGPARRLEIVGVVNEKPISLSLERNPVGLLRITIDNPRALELDATGGLRLGLLVGEADPQKPDEIDVARVQTPWKIDYLRLEAAGVTIEAAR